MEQEAITESTGYLLAHVCKTHRNKASELLAAIDLYVGQEMFLLQETDWGSSRFITVTMVSPSYFPQRSGRSKSLLAPVIWIFSGFGNT